MQLSWLCHKIPGAIVGLPMATQIPVSEYGNSLTDNKKITTGRPVGVDATLQHLLQE
jgi:hypothetical protein